MFMKEGGSEMESRWLGDSSEMAGCRQAIGRLMSKLRSSLRLVITLLLMMFVGGMMNGVKAQSPVEITTSASNPKLYLIQSYSNEAFYMRNNSRNNPQTLNTSNIVTNNSEFYFLDGGEIDETQYYFIVHKGTSKYIYMDGMTAKYGNAPAANATEEVKDTYRFKIVKNGSRDAYNIIPINQTNSLHKTDGNSVGTDIQLSGVDNDRSCWNFVAKGNYTKPSVPFIPFTANGTKAYYYLQNNKHDTYYLISGANPATDKVTTNTKASANEQNMMWYFKKAPASDNDYYIDYYYIVHVGTGKYLYLIQNNTENADNAVDLRDYDSSEDNRFLYIVVRGAVSGETHDSYSPTFCIAPQALKTKRVENTISLCKRTGEDGGNYNNAGVFKERGNNNFVHWNFEIAKTICANPVFTEENGSITLSCETDGSEIYYTENGDDPTDDGVTPTKYTNQSWLASSQHRIKAYAKLENDNTDGSNSEVATLLNKPDVTLAAGPYTYKGTAWEPAVTVSIGEGATITTAPTTPTATYNVTYSSDHTNVGTVTVTVADADANDNWYIWDPPTTTFDIVKAPLTAAADNKIVSYGDAIPTYTATYTGLVNGETNPGFTTNPTFSCEYTPTSTVSSSPFTITVSGGVSPNYEITTYNSGTLTVNPAAVTVTADDKEKTYGESDPELTATVTGLKNEDAENVISYTLSRESGEAYGNYTITPSGDANQGNYTVTYVPGTLTIKRIGVTLTANSGTETYDGTEKTVTGFTCSVDGLTFPGVSASGSGTNAGVYPVNFSGLSVNTTTDDTGNYVVDEANGGLLTINPKTLTITPKADQYKGLGEEDPELTYTYLESELVEGDEITFNGALGREVGEDVGNYEINLGTLISANTNYTLTITAGVYFTIKKSIGDGSIASGFTVEIGENNTIILKDGETTLEEGTPGADEKDFIVSGTTSGRYSQRTVTGKGTYTGYFVIRNTIVNFQTDADAMEWSATFVAEPVNPLSATDNTKGHALPEGIRAYIITDIIGDWAIPEPLDYIPEGVPVILVSDNASGGFLVEDVSGKTPPVSTNWLKEVTESTPTWVDDTKTSEPYYNATYKDKAAYFSLRSIYLLSMNEFVQNMPGYLAKGKVYLDPTTPTPSPSPAPPRLRIKWDDVTGIKELQNDGNTETQDDAAWYSLDGRKLNGKPAQKGMYINGGKKVIITSQQGNR